MPCLGILSRVLGQGMRCATFECVSHSVHRLPSILACKGRVCEHCSSDAFSEHQCEPNEAKPRPFLGLATSSETNGLPFVARPNRYPRASHFIGSSMGTFLSSFAIKCNPKDERIESMKSTNRLRYNTLTIASSSASPNRVLNALAIRLTIFLC